MMETRTYLSTRKLLSTHTTQLYDTLYIREYDLLRLGLINTLSIEALIFNLSLRFDFQGLKLLLNGFLSSNLGLLVW